MKGLWLKKIGMTQMFNEQGVLTPVTALAAGSIVVTDVKNMSRDGHDAIQIGVVRDRFAEEAFGDAWLSDKKKYFSIVREVAPAEGFRPLEKGALIDPSELVAQGDIVNVSGLTIGRGFQGGVKRHGFKGGRASHGDKLGRKPGSMGFMRSRGRVIKGWRMAGHMGTEKCTVRSLRVVATDGAAKVVFVKGSVPGKAGSLLLVEKV
jgi:large subunit ribosomal protein L3